MVLGQLPIAAFSLGHLTLGRVIIALFMVAIFLGPRRWIMWTSRLRGRGAADAPPGSSGGVDEPPAPDGPEPPTPPD